MPCRDDRDEQAPVKQSEYVDRLTAWLCDICRSLTSEQINTLPGLGPWWEEHQKRDAQRRESAAKRVKDQEERERAEYQRLAEKYGPGANG